MTDLPGDRLGTGLAWLRRTRGLRESLDAPEDLAKQALCQMALGAAWNAYSDRAQLLQQ